jgi:branched-chain amino acid transport system substrate-binding protein
MTSNDKREQVPNRRDILKGAGVAGLALTAGCISSADETPAPTEGDGGGGGSGDGGDGGDGEMTEEPTESSGSPGSYEIGMVNSLTGSLSAFGQRNERGMELALGAIEEAGGIRGSELNIVVEDSESQAQAGVSAAQKLVNQDQVPFIIGAVGSGVSLSIYESVIQGTDVVQLSQNSTSPDLTDFPGLLRMSPTGSTQSTALANIISEDGYDSVAVAWVNNDYGQGLRDTFVEEWGGEIAYDSPHDQGQSSYSSIVSSMADSGADAWVFITYQPEFTTMAQEAFSNGYEAQFYGADSVAGPDVLSSTPEGSLDNMKIVTPSAAIDQDNYQNFASQFEEEYGEAPTSWSAFAYDCVVTAALSIATASEFTGAALQETVRDVTRPDGEEVFTFAEAMEVLGEDGSPSDIDYQGVSGPIDFDENGDPVGFLQILTVQDHEYVQTGTIEG